MADEGEDHGAGEAKGGGDAKETALGCAVLLVLAGLIVGGLYTFVFRDDSSGQKTAVDTQAETTTAPATPEESLEQAIHKAIGSSNRDYEPRVTVTIDAVQLVTVVWAIDEGLTDGLTKDRARREATDILKTVGESGVAYAQVALEGTYVLVDELGNESERTVVSATYPKSLLDQVNFENFSFKKVFEITPEPAFVHPAFVY